VNSTPATLAGTNLCTTTASSTASAAMPRCWRYATARSLNSDDQQRRTAASSPASPRTPRIVSCCPAKLASGRSSAVADERTATTTSSPIPAYAVTSAAAISRDTGAASNAARTASAAPPFASPAIAATTAGARATSRYAAVVRQKPSGTGIPAASSSPRFTALPPATARCSRRSAARETIVRSDIFLLPPRGLRPAARAPAAPSVDPPATAPR
jgi:hypothetical protein